MEKWVLAIGYDKEKFNEAQRESLKYSILIRMAPDLSAAAAWLAKQNNFLLAVLFLDASDFLPPLKILRSLTKAPILVMRHRYDGAEKVAAIEAGADEYIQWPDTIPEGVASCRALIRRYTELNRQDDKQLNILSRGSIFISVDYHKVFINTQEVVFPRREFDLFYLVASNPGRVFTQEQLMKRFGAATTSPPKTACTPVCAGFGGSWRRRARPARYRIRAAWATAFCKRNHEPARSGLILEIKPLLRRNLRYLLIF